MDKPILKDLPLEASEYILRLEAENEQLKLKIERLEEHIRSLLKSRFGKSSEKTRHILDDDDENDAEPQMFNEAETVSDEREPETVTVARKKRKPKRTKGELTQVLPVEEIVFEYSDDERVCDICYGELYPIGKEFVRYEVNVIPAKAYLTAIYRINYACPDCEKESDEANIIKAPVPAPVVKRGLASPSSVAYVIYQKFMNAMPLYRQEADWNNFGLEISRATLANWIIYVCFHWLEPLWKALYAVLLKSPVIHADETVVQVLKEPGKKPQSESRMWAYCTGNTGLPSVVLFEYQPTREGVHAARFLTGFSGFLQTDGYAGYDRVENVTLCGCWAHLRRKFDEALPKTAKKDSPAAIGLDFCNQLFNLEDKFMELSPEERLAQRLEHSKPVLDGFFAWVSSVNPLAGSKLATAITYAKNQCEPLSSFLLDGMVEISNNRIENKIRPFAVGRKNWLFSDTVRGAKASAVAYSIIETARANGLNPYQYLLHLLTELPTVLTKDPNADLSRFLPWSDELPDVCRPSGNQTKSEPQNDTSDTHDE